MKLKNNEQSDQTQIFSGSIIIKEKNNYLNHDKIKEPPNESDNTCIKKCKNFKRYSINKFSSIPTRLRE
jgi:hypothetical protein